MPGLPFSSIIMSSEDFFNSLPCKTQQMPEHPSMNLRNSGRVWKVFALVWTVAWFLQKDASGWASSSFLSHSGCSSLHPGIHLREMQHLPHSSEFTTLASVCNRKALLCCSFASCKIIISPSHLNLSNKNICICSYRDKRRSFSLKNQIKSL